MSPASANDATVLVDGHVHVHPCFDLELFLRRSAANFEQAGRSLDLDRPPGLLLLTESAGDDFFGAFAARTAGDDGDWSFRRVEEASLAALERGEPRFFVLAGRQVVTAEGLEVLALACGERFPDGRPLDATLDAVRDRGALAAVPWGFGKWWGRRGKLLDDVMDRQDPAVFFLGDNGGRPRLGGRPALFERAQKLGIRILPGSDPLPFPDHAGRAGSYGFAVAGPFDPARPAESLTRMLHRAETRPRPFGRGQSILPFLRNQFAMQWRKQTGSPA